MNSEKEINESELATGYFSPDENTSISIDKRLVHSKPRKNLGKPLHIHTSVCLSLCN